MAVGLLAVGLIAAPCAASAASWSAVRALPAGPSAGQPAVAVRPDETGAAAVWVEDGRVVGATIGITGGWTAATALSPAGVYSTSPSVEYGTQGRIVVAWTQVDGFHQRVVVLTRLTSGVWSPATFVSPAGLDARQVRVVIGKSGRADLVWVQSPMSGITAIGTAGAQIDTSAPAWTVGTLGGSGSQIGTLSLAVGRGGNDFVRAAWDDESAVRTASRPKAGGWGTTTSFEAGSGTKVTVDVKGRSTVAFVSASGITVKRRASNAVPWTTAVAPGSEQYRSDLGAQFDSDMSLHVQPDGTARVYFVQLRVAGEAYAYDVRRSALPLVGQGSVDTLSQNSQDQHSGLAASIDAAGNDVAYWNAGPPYEFAARLTSAGSLAGPIFDNPSQAPPVLDAGRNGRAVVAWKTNLGLAYSIRR